MRTQSKTLFYQEAETYQNGLLRTKQAAVKDSLKGLGIYLLAVIVLVIVLVILGKNSPALFKCAVVGAPLLIGGMIIQFGIRLVYPARAITCPRCKTHHSSIYKKEKVYMCTVCGSLLLLGKDANAMPQYSGCPYCGLQTAVTNDCAPFSCPNCGIVRRPNDVQIPGEMHPCPNCEQAVPKEAIYCVNCGGILRSDLPQPNVQWRRIGQTFESFYPSQERQKEDPLLLYDQDWRIGKNAEGHLHFARVQLESIREGVKKTNDLAEVEALLLKLWDALISIEEVLQLSGLRASVEAIVPEIDETYAALLDCELSVIQSSDLEKWYEEPVLNIFVAEPHIIARGRVEEILDRSLLTSGSIGRWEDKLVAVYFKPDDDKKRQVTGFKRLKSEVTRFSAWKEQQRMLAAQ